MGGWISQLPWNGRKIVSRKPLPLICYSYYKTKRSNSSDRQGKPCLVLIFFFFSLTTMTNNLTPIHTDKNGLKTYASEDNPNSYYIYKPLSEGSGVEELVQTINFQDSNSGVVGIDIMSLIAILEDRVDTYRGIDLAEIMLKLESIKSIIAVKKPDVFSHF